MSKMMIMMMMCLLADNEFHNDRLGMVINRELIKQLGFKTKDQHIFNIS